MTFDFTGLSKSKYTWSVAPMRGQVWSLHRTGLTVVLTDDHRGYWDAVVIDAPEGSRYPVGGYDICVFERELHDESSLVNVKDLLQGFGMDVI